MLNQLLLRFCRIKSVNLSFIDMESYWSNTNSYINDNLSQCNLSGKNELKVKSNQKDKSFISRSGEATGSQDNSKCMIALWHENNLNGIHYPM